MEYMLVWALNKQGLYLINFDKKTQRVNILDMS